MNEKLVSQLHAESECELRSIALRPTSASSSVNSSRRTGGSHSPSKNGHQRDNRKHASEPNSIRDQQEDSSCSSGSDVNSEDDAHSIASRLSQLVIEQENKLGLNRVSKSSSNPQGNLLGNLNHQHHSTSSRSQSNLHVGLSEVNSHDNQRQTRSTERLPVIQVSQHEQESGPIINGRQKSGAPGQQRLHLPERGHFTRRPNVDPKRGSARPGRISKSSPNSPKLRVQQSLDEKDIIASRDSKGQLMLNIRRSTWTLAEFDQRFSDKSVASSDPHLSSSGSPPKGDSFTANQNLLMQAPTKGELASEKVNCEFHYATGAKFPPNQRRSSYGSHSIISIASSIDSFGRGLRVFGGRGNSRSTNNNCNRYKHSCRPSLTPSECRGLSESVSCFNMDTLRQYFPVLDWLPNYSTRLLYGDLMAGIAVAVLNISTSLSAAVVAETDLSPAFKTSIVNTFVYAILCSSRHTSFGSYSIMSQMLLVSVQKALSDELILDRLNLGPTATWDPREFERWHLNIIIMYTFLIGLIQLACGLLNLGNTVASFIPEALSSSMIAATAFTMAIGQLANMLGTSNKILYAIDKNTTELWADLKDAPADITDLFANLFRWVQQLALLVRYYDQINLVCVLISTFTLAVLILNHYLIQRKLKKLFKRDIFIPIEVILLVMMITVSYLMQLSERYQVPTCGPISMDFGVPDLPNLRLVRELWFQAAAAALISYTTVHIMSKTYSSKCNYEIDSNQELIACGAGNLIGGLFDALPAAASFSRTAGQVEAGGNTQMASVINCILLTVVSHFLGHHVAFLPICVMSATLFFGFARMMARMADVLNYWRVCKIDFAIWIVTFVAILASDLVSGFVYGFIFSILTILYQAQNRRCYMLGAVPGTSDVYVPLAKYKIAAEVEAIKIFQFCGPIHYVSADLFERLLRHKARVNISQIARLSKEKELTHLSGPLRAQQLGLPTHIVLDFSMISSIDSAGIRVLKKIIEDYEQVHITILIASLASHVAATVKREPSLWLEHKGRFYVTLADAVHNARQVNRRLHRLGPRELPKSLEAAA